MFSVRLFRFTRIYIICLILDTFDIHRTNGVHRTTLSANSKLKLLNFIYSFKMLGRVRFVFLLLVTTTIGHAYNRGRYHPIIKRAAICREEDGHLWYENECVCVNGRTKCCCGSEGIRCTQLISCW